MYAERNFFTIKKEDLQIVITKNNNYYLKNADCN